MNKIYIPTSSLNFNNIIATESISPIGFYKNRKFGYKRFYSVKPNPFKNFLLAYSEIPNFSINNTDLDDYPMIIEISTDLLDLNKYEKEQVNNIIIYKITDTIYFNPNKINIYFFKEEEKNISLIKVAPSIETKLMPIYQNNISITDPRDTFQWQDTMLNNISEIQNDSPDNDIYINRIKGFYYCYHLGIIFTKIKNQKLTREYPKNKIKELLQVAENDGLSDNLIHETEKLLKNFKNAYEKYKNFSNSFIVNINNYKITNFKDILLDDKNNEIYRNIINDLITYPIYDTQSFLDEKVELVLKMGENFKEIFNDKWENSKKRRYINALLDNLEQYTPFDLKDTDNEILKSISLLIFKGDDIEKLYSALQKENIKDYRLAFGLWGALFGFSAIPKTISNIFFKEESKNLINLQNFLKDMYQKIHNSDIQEDIKIDFIKEKVLNNKPIQKEILQENKSNSEIQNHTKVPKCPKCGADMVLKEPKPNDKWKAFYGCSKYKKIGCKGSRDLNLRDNSPKVTVQQKNNFEIVDMYEEIKNKGGEMKISEAKKIEKIKTNTEFKNKYQSDNRFKFYKEKNTEMIRIK